MQNTVETYEGDSAVIKTLQVIWQKKEGPYRYIPVAGEDTVKLRIFNKDGIRIEKDCTFDGDDIVVTFPDDFTPGDYDYEVVIFLPEQKEKTIIASKFHVSRR